LDEFWIVLGDNYQNVLNTDENSGLVQGITKRHTNNIYINLSELSYDLKPCKTYYWKVISTDKLDNKSVSDIFQFTTSCDSYDFLITNMKLLNDPKPNSEVKVSVTVKNGGNIQSKLSEISFYYKIPTENKITSFPKGESFILLDKPLAPGESRTYER